jgi:site-specific recombinase XerD
VQERGLVRLTVYHYARHAERFLSEQFGSGRVHCPRLRARDVTDFVHRYAREHSRGYALQLVNALRSFFRFLHYCAHTPLDLSSAVPTVAHWRMSDLPKHLSADAVKQVLAACNRASVVGRRNYAILLLLARLGLRAGEVRTLQLEDIDWTAARLTIRSRKGRGWARLPLPSDVGRAVAAHLRERPRSNSRNVFVRLTPPHTPLANPAVISVIVRGAIENAGVNAPRKGAHIFRHSLATEMLRQGASLDEIGQVLRHKDADTTAIYAKVDLTALRRLAVAIPGGVR